MNVLPNIGVVVQGAPGATKLDQGVNTQTARGKVLRSMHAVGIDIGGTKIAGAVVDEQGNIVAARRVPTDASDVKSIEDAVVAMVEDLRQEFEVAAVGVAAAGFIDAAQSEIYYAPNLAWRNEPFRDKLQARIDLPVIIENDANAAGWAEFVHGAGALTSDMVMLTIGTGVGGAVVLNDRLLRGGFGVGGELGHIRLIPDGIQCGCGVHGCFEPYGSGRALQRYCEEIADTQADGIGAELARVRAENGGELNGTLISQLSQAKDPGALEALRILGTYIGTAAASLGAVLDPQLFVIGGGVAQAGEDLLGPIREAYRAHHPAHGFHPEATFVIAELVNDAGVVGAADIARRYAEGIPA